MEAFCGKGFQKKQSPLPNGIAGCFILYFISMMISIRVYKNRVLD